jgi:hypothetical protein
MGQDKKPKKAVPAKIHGATSREGGLASKLADTSKKAPAAGGKKK